MRYKIDLKGDFLLSFTTQSVEQTENLGERLAKVLKSGDFVAFTGGLGAGKTAFCRGIAKGLECIDEVSSPTFAIVNYYRGEKPFAHFDLYRASTLYDLETAGFFDYLADGAIVAAEWSENLDKSLQTPTITVDIQLIDENSRKISIEGAVL